MTRKYFHRDPDTKEEVESKIEYLSREIARLIINTGKMQHDLQFNHLEYSPVLVRMKELGLKESKRSIERKKAQIEKYKIKLTKFKTVSQIVSK